VYHTFDILLNRELFSGSYLLYASASLLFVVYFLSGICVLISAMVVALIKQKRYHIVSKKLSTHSLKKVLRHREQQRKFQDIYYAE